MASYYLDTSALVKRYAYEQGSAWITRILDRRVGHHLYTVRLTGPEAIAAFTRKVSTGEVSAEAAARSSRVFRRHWERRFLVVEITAAIAEQAMNLAERHGLRGYDAVHLSGALTVAREQRGVGRPLLTFVSADDRQRQAALAEGLQVENPNAYV